MHFQLSKEKIKKCPGGAVWTCQMTGIDVDWAQEPGWGGVGWGERGKTTSLKRSGMLFIVYSLRK